MRQFMLYLTCLNIPDYRPTGIYSNSSCRGKNLTIRRKSKRSSKKKP